MIKRIISNPFISIVIFILGFSLGKVYDWDAFSINTEINFNLFDIISLLMTLSVAIYIAKILKSDLQKKQISRDMWINRFCQLEMILGRIEKTLLENDIYYNTIVSSLHQLRSKLSHIKSTLEKSKNKMSEDDELNALMQNIYNLRRLLTDTPVNPDRNLEKQINIKIKNKIISLVTTARKRDENNYIRIKDGIVSYSKTQMSEINSCMELIDNNIFLLKLKFASSNTITLDE